MIMKSIFKMIMHLVTKAYEAKDMISELSDCESN